MTVLAWILASSLLGGVLSISAAAVMAFRARSSAVPMLVSYSVGALLGAAFLGVLPHAMENMAQPAQLGISVLTGLLVFFVLEKLVLWRHHHAPQWGEQTDKDDPIHLLHPHGHEEHAHGRSGTLIMVGDTVHNFVDGILIAAAFLADVRLGIVTALAIMAHEIPSEVSDFLILLHSGYSRRRALLINLLSSMAMVAGGLLGYLALAGVRTWIPSLLGFVAASMIYVAVADLIPGLHRRVDLRATVQQVLLIGLGIGTIWLVRQLGH
ncbi:MAG: ZIP family metal transporter [Burkholderiales bacterium]|nr:ZIP family metal transporter [Burkholderiales bacterium]